MFQKVAKLKHGGNPYIDHETGQIIPSVTGVPGGMNAVDTSIYQTGQAVQPSALGDTKITGILGGMNEFYPIANDFADALYPQKTPEEYAAEAAEVVIPAVAIPLNCPLVAVLPCHIEPSTLSAIEADK